MRFRCAIVALGLACLPAGGRAQAPPGTNLQVYLMTMGPGAEIYERFDHNAIWIRDTAAHTDLVYNYGTFEFPRTLGGMLGFLGQFAMGRPRYWLGVENLENTLEAYTYFRRDVDVQKLNLTPAQRADIASRLAVNALEANKYYTYRYFADNCSTRVRDLLDAVLGGALRRATQGKPADGTLRFHTLRSITNDKLMYVGIDAALGPAVDRPLDQWDEMFLPIKVQQRVRELRVTGADGQDLPLVANERRLLDIGVYHVAPAPPHWTPGLLGAGIAIALLITLAVVSGPLGTIGRLTGAAWLLISGAGGFILLFFWLVSENTATFANHNLLVLSPLAWFLVRPFWRVGRQPPSSAAGWISRLVLASVAIAVALALMPRLAGQQTLPIVALAGPGVAAAAAILWLRRPAVRPPTPL